MTPLEILTAAKALIDTPEKWTINVYARNEQGNPVQVSSPQACRFCSQGAFYRVAETPAGHGFFDPPEAMEAQKFLRAAVLELTGVGDSHLAYNDTHCHANVMKMWNLAIQKAGEAECKS